MPTLISSRLAGRFIDIIIAPVEEGVTRRMVDCVVGNVAPDHPLMDCLGALNLTDGSDCGGVLGL